MLDISSNIILEIGTKQEGETCGPCFNPSKNYTCGSCIEGLECVEDPLAASIPDLPSRCKATTSKFPLYLDGHYDQII